MSQSAPSAKFVKSFADPAALPKEGFPQVVFLGRSNSGKSSLINALTGVKDLAHTSSMPGLTRLINIFEVDKAYHLVDVPGYGFAKKSKGERDKLMQLIQGYLETSPLLRLAVLIIDSRLGPTDSDQEMMSYLHEGEIPFVIIMNKVDKLTRSEFHRSLSTLQAQYPSLMVIPHSTVTGVGKGELKDLIHRTVHEAKAARRLKK